MAPAPARHNRSTEHSQVMIRRRPQQLRLKIAGEYAKCSVEAGDLLPISGVVARTRLQPRWLPS
jgi:hypothetical protein